MLRSLRLLAPLLLMVDVGLATAALKLADLLRKNIDFGMPLSEGTGWLTATVAFVAAASWLASLLLVDAHDARRLAQGGSWSRLFAANCLGVLFFVAGLFFLKIGDFSRLLVAYFFGATLLLLTSRHLLAHRLLARALKPFAQRVLLIGGGEVGLDVARRFETAPMGTELAGVIALDGSLEGLKRLGSLEQVAEVVRKHEIDEIVIALPGENHALIEKVILELQSEPVRIHLVPDILELAMIRARVEDFLGVPLVGLREPPIDDIGRLVKRIFDLLAGGVITVFAAPLMLACAALIKLHDRGPVFYKQKRIGENGMPFEMLKFRSMVMGADKKLKELGIDLEKLDPNNPVFKLQNDPRVTPIGRFLRRWSLDELPQLLNVLTGDMSLVGPRPEEAAVVARYSYFHRKRLAVKPGITGPMQVNGRGDLPLKQRLTLEIAYIESWTLWSDLLILLKTIPVVLWGKGAY